MNRVSRSSNKGATRRLVMFELMARCAPRTPPMAGGAPSRREGGGREEGLAARSARALARAFLFSAYFLFCGRRMGRLAGGPELVSGAASGHALPAPPRRIMSEQQWHTAPALWLRWAIYWREESRKAKTDGARRLARRYMREDAKCWRRLAGRVAA